MEEGKNNEITIREFIKERKDIISVWSIFAALALFIHNFISGMLGEGISFLFFSGFVLLWLDLWGSFPSKRGSLRLALFEDTIVFAGFGIVFYWFSKIWFYSREHFVFVISLSLAVPVVTCVASILRKYGILNKLFIKQQDDRVWRYVFGLFLTIIILFFIFVAVNTLVQKNHLSLDELFQSLIE